MNTIRPTSHAMEKGDIILSFNNKLPTMHISLHIHGYRIHTLTHYPHNIYNPLKFPTRSAAWRVPQALYIKAVYALLNYKHQTTLSLLRVVLLNQL